MSGVSFNTNYPLPSQSTPGSTSNVSSSAPALSVSDSITKAKSYSLVDYAQLIDSNYNDYSQFQWHNDQSNYQILAKLSKILNNNQNGFEINLSPQEITVLATPFAKTAVNIVTKNNNDIEDINKNFSIVDDFDALNDKYRPNSDAVTNPLNTAIATYKAATNTYNIAYTTFQNSAQNVEDVAKLDLALTAYQTATADYQSLDYSILDSTTLNDQVVTSTLNKAIALYNASVIAYQTAPSPKTADVITAYSNAKTTYQAAVATYNNYVNSRPNEALISAYQTAFTTYNKAYTVYSQSQKTPADATSFASAQTAFSVALTTYQASSIPTSTDADAKTSLDAAKAATVTYKTAIDTYKSALIAYQNAPTPLSTEDQTTYDNALQAYTVATTAYTTSTNTSQTSLAIYNMNVDGLLLSASSLSLIEGFNAKAIQTNEDIHAFATRIVNFNADQITNFPDTGTLLSLPSPPFTQQASYDFNSTYTLSSIGISSSAVTIAPLPIPKVVTGPSSTLTPNYQTTDDYLKPLVSTIPAESALDAQAGFSTDLKAFENYRDYIKYYLRGKNILLPDSFITPTPVTTSENSLGNVPVGVSLIGSNVDNPFVSAAVATTLYISELLAKDYQNSLPNKINAPSVEDLKNFFTASATQSALSAGVFLANQAKDGASVENGLSANVLLALGIANQINQAMNSNDSVTKILTDLQENFPGIDSSKLQSLATGFAQGININLIQMAIAIMGQTINDPNLVAKVASLNPAINPVLNAEINVKELLTNAQVVTGLKDTLIASQTATADVINTAINKTLNNKSIVTAEQFTKTLSNELTKQGVNSSTSNTLSSQAMDYVNTDNDHRYVLDLSLNSKDINAAQLASQLAKGTNGLISLSSAKDLIQTSIAPNQTVSVRQLRDKLNALLSSNGIDPTASLSQATTNVLTSLNLNATLTTQIVVSQNALKLDLNNDLTRNLSKELKLSAAQKLSNQVVEALFNQNNSLVTQLNTSINVVKKLENKSTTEAVTNSFINYMKPTKELYTFIQQLLSPANSIVHATYGAMYQGIIKTEHPLPLDIQE